MRLGSIAEARGYAHVVISPHFDDAALSLGGTIAQAGGKGERVLVVTVCAAVPKRAPETPFIEAGRRRTGLGPTAFVEARRQEDAAAMAIIGADHFWAGVLDVIYRAPEGYPDEPSLFRSPAGDDPALDIVPSLLRRLCQALPDATF